MNIYLKNYSTVNTDRPLSSLACDMHEYFAKIYGESYRQDSMRSLYEDLIDQTNGNEGLKTEPQCFLEAVTSDLAERYREMCPSPEEAPEQ